MKGYTVGEAAVLLKQPTDYLLKIILFSGKTHPILKPCIFLSEPTSMRLAHRNANIYVTEAGIEHTMQSINALPDDPAEAARQIRINRHWKEDALTPFKYPQVIRQGVFELTFYPEYMNTAEFNESGRIQLYRRKAVHAPLANAAVDRIMNNWYAMSREEISKEKDRISSKVGEMLILTQDNLHYLVDTPVSISLSDIRITDKMLSEYAASEGIKLSFPPMETAPRLDQSAKKATVYYTQEEAAAILEMTEEEIFRLSCHERFTDEKRIFAGMLITKPLSVLRVRTTGKKVAETHLAEYGGGLEYVATEESISGFFELIDLPEMQDKTWTKPITRLSAYESGDWFQIPGGKSFKKSDFRYSRASLKHYAESMRRDIVFPDAMPKIKLRHKISKDEWKSKRKSAIQLAVEAFLDDTPEGNKVGFYAFLKKQLNLQKEEPFKDGQPYAYYFKDVKEKGNHEGVYLQRPKEGKKEGNPSWNHYSGDDISSILSKERGRRKKLASK
ncbi:hypothetical protein [Trichlorobacter lovleyi]|uniref:hypothetical protein n=1 Tax=Trichlorobacter lovleyi TaxID=313985 RepID=UPI003D0CA263